MISVVISTYKREPQIIDRAIRSVLSQTYQDIELFVVDDSPSDYPLRGEVEALVQHYCTASVPVQYIAHEKNMGACKARNTGLAVARGEYVAFLDDDDEWLPNKLELQLQKIEAMGETTGYVYCCNFEMDEKSEKKSVRNKHRFQGNIYDELLTYGNFIGSTSFPLLRTELLKEIGGFDEELLSGQDYDVWIRMAERSKVGVLEEPLGISYYHVGERITTNPKKKIQGIERIYQKNSGYFSQHPGAAWRTRCHVAPYYARNKQLMAGLSVWCEAVRLQPRRIKDNVLCLLKVVWGRLQAK